MWVSYFAPGNFLESLAIPPSWLPGELSGVFFLKLPLDVTDLTELRWSSDSRMALLAIIPSKDSLEG